MGSKKHRWPLWKRSLWHALKSLVRNNPRAALSAAGLGQHMQLRGAEEVESELMGSATPEKHQVKATHDEKTEFVKSLSPADRKALAQFQTKKGAASPDSGERAPIPDLDTDEADVGGNAIEMSTQFWLRGRRDPLRKFAARQLSRPAFCAPLRQHAYRRGE